MVILPCPFCGEAPEIEPKDPKREGDAWARIVCSTLTCSAKPDVIVYENGHDRSVLQAVRRWNNRVAPPVIAYFCVNTVTGKMLYTDSQSQMVAMRDCKAGYWQITELAAVGVQVAK